MRKFAFMSILLTVSWLGYAQKNGISKFQYLGEDYFDHELYLGVAVRYVYVEFPNAPRPENHRLGVWTGDFQMYRTSIEPGGMRYMFRNKLLGEIFRAFGEDFTDIYRDEGSTFSHFLAGAHDFAWNVTVQDRWALAVGFNFTDLQTGSTLIVPDEFGNDERITPAPHGWYIGAGPGLFADFMISDFLLLEFQADHTFHFANLVPLTYGEKEPDQIMPQHSYFSLNLLTGWGFYTGFDVSFLYDSNGYNLDANKFEWLFGFKIML